MGGPKEVVLKFQEACWKYGVRRVSSESRSKKGFHTSGPDFHHGFAIGWMLREIWQPRSGNTGIPRTMFRYAIERLDEPKRQENLLF